MMVDPCFPSAHLNESLCGCEGGYNLVCRKILADQQRLVPAGQQVQWALPPLHQHHLELLRMGCAGLVLTVSELEGRQRAPLVHR